MPDYNDPLRTAAGVVNGLAIAVVVWAGVAVVVLLLTGVL